MLISLNVHSGRKNCESGCLEASVFLQSSSPAPASLDLLSSCYFCWPEILLFCPGRLVAVNLSLRRGRESYACLAHSLKMRQILVLHFLPLPESKSQYQWAGVH